MEDKVLREKLRMLVREERDQGRINESEAIALHRYINRTGDLAGIVETQARLLAELPPSVDQLLQAQMDAAVARIEVNALKEEIESLKYEVLEANERRD